MQHNSKEKPSEWVGAPVAPPLCERKKGCVKETFTPSDRVLRPRPVTKLVEDQASDVKLATENVIGSVKKSSRNEAKLLRIQNSQTQNGRKTNRKMSSSAQPEQPLRADSNLYSNQLPPSFDGGLRDDHSNAIFGHLLHSLRASNSTEIVRKMEA